MQAIAAGKLDEAGLSAAERVLLEYVGKVTEPQIAEAVYITAMFAFFNRVADAFGVPPQGYLERGGVTG